MTSIKNEIYRPHPPLSHSGLQFCDSLILRKFLYDNFVTREEGGLKTQFIYGRHL
jgi:hypothetical protein